MLLISVPFCYLPNSKRQVFNIETMRRTKFQINQVAAIAAREDFAYFVTNGSEASELIVPPEFGNPFCLLWYNKTGELNFVLIGRIRILRQFSTGDNPPVPLDHVVYSSRCA